MKTIRLPRHVRNAQIAEMDKLDMRQRTACFLLTFVSVQSGDIADLWFWCKSHHHQRVPILHYNH